MSRRFLTILLLTGLTSVSTTAQSSGKTHPATNAGARPDITWSSETQLADAYYVGAYRKGAYLIDHKGVRITAKCRNSLYWPNGLGTFGTPVLEHGCVYMHGLIGKSVGEDLMKQWNETLVYSPYAGREVVQTADYLDIIDEQPLAAAATEQAPVTTLKRTSVGQSKSSQDAYVITDHKTVSRDDGTNFQDELYTVVHGANVVKVRYAESQTSTAKPGDFPGTGLHLHTSGSNPDLSQIPEPGVTIPACLMHKDSHGDPTIAKQPTPEPCMARVGGILHYELSPNGPVLFTYVNFDILSETIATSSNAPQAQTEVRRKDIPAIHRDAEGAVVTIVMETDDKPIALGTGFLVRDDGVIVTNYHVVAKGNVAIVKFSDGTALPVDGVLAADRVRDLAIVKIHGKNLRALTLGNSDRVQVGEEVVAIGNPLGLELTVSNGIVSGVRTVEKAGGRFLQITAPISHGSSGGPLFNMFGEVIGINAMFLEGGENLNFAIPVNDARRLLSDVSSKLEGLPNEPLNDDSQDPKPTPPDRRQELAWLSTERFINPAFSALFPRRKPNDPEIYCRSQDHKSEQQKVFTSTQCNQRTEGGAVEALILYSDLPFEVTSDSRAESMQYAIHSTLVNAIDISASEPMSIYQDQTFTAIPPIPALESTAKGTLEGHPAKVCVRSGGQGRRQWLLILAFADSSGHTKKQCDAFFDSVVVK